MKKIVGILLAGALVVSAFAADVSAKVVLEGELLNINDGKVNAFNIKKPGCQTWNPIMNLSVNGDRAGSEFCVFTGDLKKDIGGWQKGYSNFSSNYKIWVKPIDSLKLVFGHNGFNLNQETILYSKSYSGIDDIGYALNFAMNGFSLDFMMAQGWDDSWLSVVDENVNIAQTGIKAEYAADFGKINGILVAKDTFKDLRFGVGYANTFSGVNIFANVLGFVNNGFNALRVELFAKGNVDAFGWAVYPVLNVNLGDTAALDMTLIARADYRFNGITAYLVIGQDSANQYNPINGGSPAQGTYFGLVNNDKFNMTIAPGASGNIGGAGWDVSLKFDIGKEKVIVSVPVVFSMGW